MNVVGYVCIGLAWICWVTIAVIQGDEIERLRQQLAVERRRQQKES